MNPGIELDKLIAEKIFGIPKESIDGIGGTWNRRNDEDSFRLLAYSTAIADAWQVVEKLSKTNFLIETRTFVNQPWHSQCLILPTIDDEWIVEEGESVPHAICLCALKAVGVEGP